MAVKHLKLHNGESLAYRESGIGQKAIILIHGNMCSSEHFTPLLRKMSTERYTCYAVDLRGVGDSSYGVPIKAMHDFSDDLYDFICQLGLSSVTLIGWSAGGAVCLQFSIAHPDLVNGVVLLNSVGIKGDPLMKEVQQGRGLDRYLNKSQMSTAPEVYFPLQAIKSKDFKTMDSLWKKRNLYKS